MTNARINVNVGDNDGKCYQDNPWGLSKKRQYLAFDRKVTQHSIGTLIAFVVELYLVGPLDKEGYR